MRYPSRRVLMAMWVAAVLAAGTSGVALQAQNASPHAAAAEAAKALQALHGRTSLLVLENRRELLAYRAGTPMAVGSSFKMAIALALRKQIEAGTLRWTDVYRIRSIWKVPGGVLFDWPDQVPMTIEMLAGFMISKSDNTGTDAIFHIVGRRNIEPYTGRNRPLLSTHDLYTFKDHRNRTLVERWRRGNEAQRRTLLAEIDNRPLDLDNGIFFDAPYAHDVEWYFTNRELCALIAQVADLPIMGISAHGITKSEWAKVAFKGGSEPGVISATYALTTKDGRAYCVSASWNNSGELVDPNALLRILTTLFDVLKR